MKTLKAYFVGRHAVRLTIVGQHVLLDLTSDTEEPEYDEERRGLLAALSRLRAELLQGGLRPAYLAWLLAVQEEEVGDDAIEPPVPIGLAKLTAPQTAMVEFLRIDVDLIAAAASGSAASTQDSEHFQRWLLALPIREKDAWLLRAARDPGLALGDELRRAFRTTVKSKPSNHRRTVAELRAAVDAQRAARKK